MEIQVKEAAINEDKYEDPDKAFVTPDHSGGVFPEYFSNATSITGSSSACVCSSLPDSKTMLSCDRMTRIGK